MAKWHSIDENRRREMFGVQLNFGRFQFTRECERVCLTKLMGFTGIDLHKWQHLAGLSAASKKSAISKCKQNIRRAFAAKSPVKCLIDVDPLHPRFANISLTVPSRECRITSLPGGRAENRDRCSCVSSVLFSLTCQ